MTAAVTDRGSMVFQRRRLLGGLLALGSAVMGVVLLFPLLRSLGPKPAKSEGTTRADGRLAVHHQLEDGQPAGHRGRPAGHRADLEVGGVLTVFPRGFVGSSPDQIMLIRLAKLGPLDPPYPIAPPGHTDWGVQGYVAYSKLCTHVGCPVGLYQEQTQQLLCPCHQSLFDVLAGAEPEFGPPPARCPSCPSPSTPPGSSWPRAASTRRPGPDSGSGRHDRQDHRHVAALARRAPRRGQGRAHLPRQDLPRPLVVPARGDRALLLRGADRHRGLPLAVLHALGPRDRLPRLLRAAAGPAGLRGLRLVGGPVLRRAHRPAHAPDAPLGRRRLRRLDRRAHGPDLLHRRLPQAPRVQLDRRA